MVIERKGQTAEGELDPQIVRVLAAVDSESADGHKPLSEKTAADVRAAPDPIETFGIASEPVHDVTEITVPTVDGKMIGIRLYRPKPSDDLPILIYFHGGCWVFCGLDTHDNICRALCNRADYLVASVAYRLAPEHPFPAAVEDAYAATRWLSAYAGEFGGDTSHIVVGGDSAGGNLAAVVTLMARDRGGPQLAGQLLIYPIVDISTFSTVSYRQHAASFLSKEMMQWASERYVTRAADRTNPYVSPLLAPDLRGLPPTFLLTAEADVLRDEGEAYARRLAKAGNEVKCVRYKGMVHAFVAMAGAVEMGIVALSDSATWLSRMLQTRS